MNVTASSSLRQDPWIVFTTAFPIPPIAPSTSPESSAPLVDRLLPARRQSARCRRANGIRGGRQPAVASGSRPGAGEAIDPPVGCRLTPRRGCILDLAGPAWTSTAVGRCSQGADPASGRHPETSSRAERGPASLPPRRRRVEREMCADQSEATRIGARRPGSFATIPARRPYRTR